MPKFYCETCGQANPKFHQASKLWLCPTHYSEIVLELDALATEYDRNRVDIIARYKQDIEPKLVAVGKVTATHVGAQPIAQLLRDYNGKTISVVVQPDLSASPYQPVGEPTDEE